ncbi:hypothetical protein PBAC_17100 [Pedobacter glucosidilyticus]|nr:hypothetical protein [Pedobacter glucosidilyticus]KHJ38169.1 hypothetical protein PBAC_17100 [Pedobacter glucosidilyticus]
MESKNQLIFQVHSPAVLKEFSNKNFLIEYDNTANLEENLCVIYFSSNEIYYPNTNLAFKNAIIQRDKYEWKRNKFPQARKHIFLRDIRKQWYIGGINAELDNPLKLLDFLKKETDGYTVFTIGSSAGGYAATLFGSLLSANRVYAFNAQLNLKVIINNSNPLTDPILFEKREEVALNSYFDLSNYLTSHTDYYYFQSAFSKIDLEQYNAITPSAKEKLKIIRFKTSNHGFPFLRINIPYILSFKKANLDLLANKTYHPIFFSVRLIGVLPTISFVFKALFNRYKKKRLEASFKKT